MSGSGFGMKSCCGNSCVPKRHDDDLGGFLVDDDWSGVERGGLFTDCCDRVGKRGLVEMMMGIFESYSVGAVITSTAVNMIVGG